MKTTLLNNKHSRSIMFVLAITFIFTSAKAQQLTINQRSHLVMNGNVSLVINNAVLSNNGNFAAGTGNVKFTGTADSTASNVNGTASTVFYDLTISKTANSVALKSATAVRNTLTVESGNLYTNNKLTLKSDSLLTARVAPVSGSIVGKATVERYIPARRAWRMLTAPLSSSNSIYDSWQNGGVYEPGVNTFVTGPNPSAANGLDASPMNNVSMKTWNAATQAFGNVVNTYAPISQGNSGNADNTGYFIFVRGDRNSNNFSTTTCNATTLKSNGNLQQGTQNFAVSSVAGAYTLVGNPYASPVNFNTLTRNNVLNRFYVWDPALNSVGGYVMLDDLNNTGTYTRSVSGSSQGKEIQSGQAFMVQTATAGAASVIFNEANKSGVNNNSVFRPLSNNSTTSQKLGIDLDIIQADGSIITADGTFAEFNEGYSSAVDYFDALKFTNINECLALVRNNTALTAERRSPVETADTLFIKIWKTNIGYNYRFVINPSAFPGTHIVLVDRYTGINTPVSQGGTTAYNFTVDANAASTGAGRFMIILSPVSPVVVPVSFATVNGIAAEGKVTVEWNVENENNLARYEVEQSANGTDFTTAGIVTANNTGAHNNYILNNVSFVSNTGFYRIKAIDIKGAARYSTPVKVTNAKKAASFASIFPNPVNDCRFNLQLNIHATGVYKLTLTNAIGQVVYATSKVFDSNTNTLQVSLPGKLAAGLYNLEVVNPAAEREVLQLIAE